MSVGNGSPRSLNAARPVSSSRGIASAYTRIVVTGGECPIHFATSGIGTPADQRGAVAVAQRVRVRHHPPTPSEPAKPVIEV